MWAHLPLSEILLSLLGLAAGYVSVDMLAAKAPADTAHFEPLFTLESPEFAALIGMIIGNRLGNEADRWLVAPPSTWRRPKFNLRPQPDRPKEGKRARLVDIEARLAADLDLSPDKTRLIFHPVGRPRGANAFISTLLWQVCAIMRTKVRPLH